MDRSRTRTAYDALRRRLECGDLPMGARLSPADLAVGMHMSHIPVREAISRLISDGLAESRPGQGTFVCEPAMSDLMDLLDMRQALECHAAAAAARRIGDADILRLRELVVEMERVAREVAVGSPTRAVSDRWRTADLAIHRTVLEVAGNRRVLRLIDDARVLSRMLWFRCDHAEDTQATLEDLNGNVQVHHEVVEALAAHDPHRARIAMTRHMRRARRNLTRRLLERPPLTSRTRLQPHQEHP